MSETTTLPKLRDAMTAADVLAHMRHLRQLLGGPNSLNVWINEDRYGAGNGPAGIYVREGRDDEPQCFDGATWADAFQAAYAWSAGRKAIRREATVRKMALAIMDLKDQHGRVTLDMLVGRKFDHEDVRKLHAEACIRAGEFAGGAPFSVEGA